MGFKFDKCASSDSPGKSVKIQAPSSSFFVSLKKEMFINNIPVLRIILVCSVNVHGFWPDPL